MSVGAPRFPWGAVPGLQRNYRLRSRIPVLLPVPRARLGLTGSRCRAVIHSRWQPFSFCSLALYPPACCGVCVTHAVGHSTRLPVSFIRASQSSPVPNKSTAAIENSQPRGFAAQPLKQASRSASQSGPIIVGTAGVATCWVPIVGGGPPVPRSLTHVSNAARQPVEHPACTILFFGMGVKLPARLA
jgi:hypothetical protein